MKKIVIYTKEFCPYCDRAKALFKRYNLPYEQILVDSDEAKEKMIQLSNGRKTFPQIFIGETHIGGYDDLLKLGEQILTLVQ